MEKYEDKFLYKLLRPFASLFIRLFRPVIINNEIIPKDKKVILVGNHTSKLDAFLLMSTTKRHIHFLAKKELFSGITGIVINRLGLIRVDRESSDKSDVLKNAKNYLNNDKVVLVFPEGTTEKENFPNLLPFKIGAVKLSYETDTYIVPFKIIGRYKFLKRSVKIVFGSMFKSSSDLNESNKKLFNIINNIKD